MTRVNERIRAPRVRVIVSGTNEQLGVLPTDKALQEAKIRGLDLVEIASSADPPVCKIVDYGKYKYEQAKLKKDRGKKVVPKLKEVKFRVRIDPHDYNIKMAHAEEFLDAGNKLRLQLQFRGREMAHPEIGFDVMRRVRDDLSGMANVDMEPKQAGRSITMMMSPLPAHARKRSFRLKHGEILPPDVDDDFDDEDDDYEADSEDSNESSTEEVRESEG